MRKISVIIPVRTITNFLLESLPYLTAQSYKNFEVLVITDEKEELKGYPQNFKIVPSGKVGPAEKRNLAKKYATGEVLAFLDDDAYPQKDWLKNAERLFSNKYCGIGGPSVTPTNETFLAKISGDVLSSYLTSGGTVHRHIPQEQREVDDYPTVNLFVLKKDFVSVGGFDPEFWPGEDTKLCLDLLKKTNKKILYSPQVLVSHHRRNLFRPHLKQISRYGMHRGQFARIFPENSRKLQYFIPSIFVLGLIVGPFLSLVSAQFFCCYLLGGGIYFSLVLLESAKCGIRQKSFRAAVLFALGVFLTHIVYGVNFIYGLFKRPKLHLRSVDKKSNKYLGG